MKAFYRGAQAYVSIARLLSAAFYFVIGILLISFALWLAFTFGESWILAGIAILVGLQGAAIGVKASEMLLSTRPTEQASRREEHPPSSRRNRDDRT